MSSKYNDPTAVIQVIGCVYNDPLLLDASDKYSINEEDFADDFHRIIFGAIYKLFELGVKKITLEAIADFLSSRPKLNAIYTQQKGEEWLLKASESADRQTFDYYYGRLKKFTLLRAYDNFGLDVRFIYDPDNILDVKKRQLQEDQLDNSTLEDIAHLVDSKIEEIKERCVDDVSGDAYQAGEGVDSLIDRLKERPEVGVPLYGPLINTVTRGARLKKFYLRSAATGIGKSRTMIADACYIGCDMIWDELIGWRTNGIAQPVVYISTEQELEEIQTMMLAFLSNVNEEHILNGRYEGDEETRVRKAGEILARSPVYIETLPDFSLQDIEDTIKKNIREHNVKYVFYDYIHTSLKILEEITRKTGGVKLREDNILFMLSIRLKDICNQYGVFIMSSTQLNGDYVESETPDQNLLRGAKSIADWTKYYKKLLTCYIYRRRSNLMKKIIFNKKQQQDIIQLYQKNNALQTIAERYGTTRNVIKKLLLSNDIVLRSRTTKYTGDYNCFNVIDSNEKAYWLGFIAADGGVYKRNHTKAGSFLYINLSRKDKQHLEKFKQFLNSNVAIKDYVADNGFSNHTEMSSIVINSNQLVNDLIRYGIVPKKSLVLLPPNIPSAYSLAFIKGYFDGDGSIYQNKTKEWGVSIEGTKEILNWINDTLHINCKLEKRYQDDNNNYYIRCGGKQKPFQIMKLFYESVNISLDRKLKKYNTLKAVVLNSDI